MTRTKKFFYNSITSAILQIVLLIINFILPKVMLDIYGSEINGLCTSILQFISYFNLVEAGLASAAVFSLYKPLAENNHKKINEVVSTAKSFYFKSGLIFTILVILLAIFYPFFTNLNQLSNVDVFFLVLILGASGFLDFFTLAKYRVLLTADQKVYVISLASIVYNVLNTVLIIILSYMGFNIVFVRFIAVFAIIIRSIILSIYVKRKYTFLKYNIKENKRLIDKRWDALYLQILGTIQNGAPVVLLTIFSNLITVSIYSIYNMVIHGINSILSIFTSGLSSSFGEIIAKNEKEKLKVTSEEFEYIYYNIITIFYAVTFVLIMPFIKLYVGNVSDANYYIPLVGFLFVLNGLLYNIKTPQGMLVISAGMYKETRWRSTIQGLIIVILGILLTPKFGIIGVMIASIISNLYRDIDLILFIPKYLTKRSVWSTLKRIIKLFCFILIILLVDHFLNIKIINYIDWGIYGLIVTIVVSLIILIFDSIFEKKLLKKVLIRIKGLIGR